MSSSKKRRILIVDDEAAPREMLAKVLEHHGYEVDTADGADCALILSDFQSYDLAILDFRMPEVNGAELFQNIRASNEKTVGVFLTGYPTLDTVVPGIEAGIQRFFAKPVQTQELIEFIEMSLPDSA